VQVAVLVISDLGLIDSLDFCVCSIGLGSPCVRYLQQGIPISVESPRYFFIASGRLICDSPMNIGCREAVCFQSHFQARIAHSPKTLSHFSPFKPSQRPFFSSPAPSAFQNPVFFSRRCFVPTGSLLVSIRLTNPSLPPQNVGAVEPHRRRDFASTFFLTSLSSRVSFDPPPYLPLQV